MSARVRVAAWLLLLGVLALAALWSAADRLARQGVLFGLPTPLLTGGNALTARAAVAQARGDIASAQALSRAALRRRSVDAATLRVAGLAAFATEDDRQGDALMRLAGTAGWRDVPTQLYWAESALATGALDVAGQRLDAAARTGTRDARLWALLLQLEAIPAGRAALIERLRVGNDWSAAHLSRADGLDARAMEARLATITAARRAGIALDEASLARLGWALLGSGRADLAYRLAGERATSLAFRTVSAPGPFDWTLLAAAGLDAAAVPQGNGWALRIGATGPAALPVATRHLRLPPGDARLVLGVSGARSDVPLLATLDCVTGTGADATAEPVAAGRVLVRLHVPAGCPTQRLTLAVAGEEARRGAELTVSEPVVTAAP